MAPVTALTWKPGPPPLDRLNEGWLRHRNNGCTMLTPYRVRYSRDTLKLAVFIEEGGWQRFGRAFLSLITDHSVSPAPPEPKITSVVMPPEYLEAGRRLMARYYEAQFSIPPSAVGPIPDPPEQERR